MKLFLLSSLFVAQVGFASNPAVLECSDSAGRLTYLHTQYDGGAFPTFPDFELSRETWKLDGKVLAETIRQVAGSKDTGLIHTTWGARVTVDETHIGDLPNGFRIYAQELTWDDGTMLKAEETHLLCRQTLINIAKP